MEAGWTEAVPEGSTYKLNVSVDPTEAAAMPGEAGNDWLLGGRGNDLLDGGLGSDMLGGGAGEDTFRFSTELGDGNVDRIRDFRVADDIIQLDSAIFAEAGPEGALAASAFARNATGTATDSQDRILYDTRSGILSYDADGSGDGAAIEFAQLARNLDLTSDHFVII